MVEIASTILALSICSLLLWFLMPMLNLTRLTTAGYVDETDPINQLSIQMGDALFLVVGFVGILTGSVLLLTTAFKREAFE
jgi:hypothetical protein